MPEDKKAVLVLEIDPDRMDEAVGGIQRFILSSDVSDRRIFGRTMHVAIEDKAEKVLTVFENAPFIDDDKPESALEPT